jgi:hypothetical protein
VNAAFWNIYTLHGGLGEIMSLFAVVGAFGLLATAERRRRWEVYLPPFFFLGLLFASWSLIATFPSAGGFHRSIQTIIPFFIVIGVDAITRTILSRSAVALTILLIASSFFFHSISNAKSFLHSNAELGEQLSVLKSVVLEDAHKQRCEAIIMTRDPWEVHYSTGCKVIQVPNENFEIIYQVAAKFGANYLLLPAPREALKSLYEGKVSDHRFQFIATIPNSDLKLFRISLK